MKIVNGKKLIRLLATQILCVAGFFCVSASAGVPGTAGAAFLKFTPSPRATAMGESYSAVTEDAYAAYWNPAGLASVERIKLSATYNASFEDVTHQYVSLAYPLKIGSTLDLNITRMSVGAFKGYGQDGVYTSMLEASDMAIGIAYGRTLMKDEIERPVLNVGINLKTISETLGDASSSAFAADLGVLWYLRPASYWIKKVRAQEFRLALSIKNLGTGLKFDKESSPLPLSVTVGSAWVASPDASSTLILTMDQTVAADDKYSINLGAEYEAFQLLALRAGYRTGQSIGSGVRFGIGFKLSVVDLDYSMSPFGELGTMQKLGMSVAFGNASGKGQRVATGGLISTKESIEKLQVFANDFIELAKKNLEKREYLLADANFNKAFNLQPVLKAGEWGNKDDRLAAIIKELRLKDTPGLEGVFGKDNEQANVGSESILAYVNGADLKAFLLAHAAWGANISGEPVFERLLNVLSQLTQDRVRRDEILPKIALVKEKLRKAASAFYIQQFNVAVKECEEAVLIDNTNAVVWTRLGSAYFMMGDKGKARSAYVRALELSPGDKVIKQFMDAQGWK